MDEQYQELANAIVIFAAREYRCSRRKIRRLTDAVESFEKRMKETREELWDMPNGKEKRKKTKLLMALEDRAASASAAIKYEKNSMKSIERFFESDWADLLSGMDASAILEGLKKDDDDDEDTDEDEI